MYNSGSGAVEQNPKMLFARFKNEREAVCFVLGSLGWPINIHFLSNLCSKSLTQCELAGVTIV